jgi:hypothetical protein
MITNRVNELTDELCEEIDRLRVELEASRVSEKYWREKNSKLQNQCLQDSQKITGMLLGHMLKTTSL